MAESTYKTSIAPIRPYSEGTGDVECLTSVFLRIAEHHCLLPSTLLRQYFFPEFTKNKENYYVRPEAISAANGYSASAKRLSEQLQLKSLGIRYDRTTCLAWGDALNANGRGLLAKKRRWCSFCFKEDYSVGKKPYTRLYWSLNRVSSCIKHFTKLESTCPSCKQTQPFVPRLPTQEHCYYCGIRLLETNCNRSECTDKELWYSNSIYELVDTQQQLDINLKHTELLGWLHRIHNKFRKIGVHSVGYAAGLSEGNYRRWITGISKPSFHILLDFCWATRCPPATILTGQDSLLTLTRPHHLGHENRESSRINSQHALAHIEHKLNRILSGQEPLPNSLNQVAGELGCQRGYLTTHFKNKAQDIIILTKAKREKEQLAKNNQQIERLQQGLDHLFNTGIYPSNRHLRIHLGISGSMIQRPIYRKIINECRDRFRY